MLAPTESPRDGNALESAIGGKLAVWVGAIALALGGVFLVKLSIEQGMLPEELRLLGGLLLGFGLGGAAWRLRDRSNYVAQGLAAAAVIVIYACLWAGVNLYEIVPAWLALIGMVFTTLAAVGLALRLGPLVAIIGLLGAFLAPLLVGRNSDNVEGLFAYLLALQAGSQFLARRRRWIWASGIGLTAGALWVLVHLVGGGEQVLPGLFLIGSTAVFVMPELLRPSAGKGSEVAVWVASAVGTLLMALTLRYSNFEPHLWAFFGVLVVVTGVLALWQARYARLPWLTFGVTLVLAALQNPFGSWTPEATLTLALSFGGLFAAISYISLWRHSGRQLLPLVIAAPAAFIFVSLPVIATAFELETWMYVIGGAGLVYWLLFIPALITRNRIEHWRLGWILMPAMALTAAAWPFGLALHWCVMLWSAQLVLAIALDRRFQVDCARWCGLAMVAVLHVCLLSPLVLLLAVDMGTTPVLNWVSLAYICAIVATLAARLMQPAKARSLSFLSISALLLILGWAGVNIHHAANGGEFLTTNFSAVEICAHVMVLLTMSLWLVHRAPHLKSKTAELEDLNLREFGVGMGLMALFLGTLALATVGNPWVRHEAVGGPMILNSLLIALGLPAMLMGLLSMALGLKGYAQERIMGWYCTGAMSVLLTMLLVRHAFHGAELWVGAAVEAEHYAYSLALALLAMLALAIGIRRNSRQLRVIALLGMLACSIKVFGFDMRALQGIYRVLSFLGLGASLMALGYVYNRFGPKPRPRVTEDTPTEPLPPVPEMTEEEIAAELQEGLLSS